MQSKLVTFTTRHKYFNDIYDDLHPSNDKETRIYHKPKPNFDFALVGNTLTYNKYKELDFNKKSISNFKSFKETDTNPDQMPIQGKISFYLTNNLVPVYKTI